MLADAASPPRFPSCHAGLPPRTVSLSGIKRDGECPPACPGGTLVHRATRTPPRSWRPMVSPAGDFRLWLCADGIGRLGGSRQPSGRCYPMIEVNAAALAAHPFLHGMSQDQLAVLAEGARDVSFPARHRLFEDGGYATHFWLIMSGHVWLDLNVPGEGPVVIETIGMGELLGWSWLFPPYKWGFGAVAVPEMEAFEFDAR